MICIAPNLNKATKEMLKEKDVIIVDDTDEDTVSNAMEKVRDNDGRWDDGYGSTYEARVVIGTYAKWIQNQDSSKVCVGLAMGMVLGSTGLRRETMHHVRL